MFGCSFYFSLISHPLTLNFLHFTLSFLSTNTHDPLSSFVTAQSLHFRSYSYWLLPSSPQHSLALLSATNSLPTHYSSLFTANSSLLTLYFSLFIAHSPIHTNHFTLLPCHFPQLSHHWSLLTNPSTIYSHFLSANFSYLTASHSSLLILNLSFVISLNLRQIQTGLEGGVTLYNEWSCWLRSCVH